MKKNLFYARLYDFFSNFAYCSKSTENYLFNSFKKNDVNINDATIILSLMTEITKRKKTYRSIIFQASYSRLIFYYTERLSGKLFFIDFKSEHHFKILFRSHFKNRQEYEAILQYESRKLNEIF